MGETSEQEDRLQSEAKKWLADCEARITEIETWRTEHKIRPAKFDNEWYARFKAWYAENRAWLAEGGQSETEAPLARVDAAIAKFDAFTARLDACAAKLDAWGAEAKASPAGRGAWWQNDSRLIAEAVDLIRESGSLLPDKRSPVDFFTMTLRIEELFVEATKRFRAPSLEGCAAAVVFLETVRMLSAVDPVWRLDWHAPKAKRAAQIFLAHTAPLRKSLAHYSTLANPDEPGEMCMCRANFLKARTLVEMAVQAVEAALPVLSEIDPPEADTIQHLAWIAQRVWADTNDGDAPRGVNPDDPLVKFVTAALTEIGINHSRATVSAVLRGRRRTKRRDKTSH